MTKQTKEAIKTSAVIVLAIVAVLALWVYPLNQAGKIVSRSTETAEPIHLAELDLAGEPFKILTEDNLTMAGFFLEAHLDSSRTAPVGTFMLLHGLFGGMESQIDKARDLTAMGYDVIIYDQRAFGQSDGKYCSGGFFEANDLQSLISRFDLEDRLIHPVILWGEQQGGTAAIRTAVIDKRADVIIAENPVVDAHDWMKRVIAHKELSAPDIYLPFIWWWVKQKTSYEIQMKEMDISEPFAELTESHEYSFLTIATGTGDIPGDEYQAELRNLGGQWMIVDASGGDIYRRHKDAILAKIASMLSGN